MGVDGSANSVVLLAQAWAIRVFPLHLWRGGEKLSLLLGADGSLIPSVSGALKV